MCMAISATGVNILSEAFGSSALLSEAFVTLRYPEHSVPQSLHLLHAGFSSSHFTLLALRLCLSSGA